MRIDSGTVVAAQYLEAYILAPSDDMPLLSRLVAKSEAAGHDVSSLGALQRLLRARRPSDDDAAVAAFVDQLNAKTLSGDAAMTACEWQARRAAEAETRRAAEETRRAAAAAETRRRAEQEAKAECAMAEAVARGAAAARRAEEAAAAADTESSVASSEASVTSSEEGASSAEEDANATAEAARERHALEAEYSRPRRNLSSRRKPCFDRRRLRGISTSWPRRRRDPSWGNPISTVATSAKYPRPRRRRSPSRRIPISTVASPPRTAA